MVYSTKGMSCAEVANLKPRHGPKACPLCHPTHRYSLLASVVVSRNLARKKRNNTIKGQMYILRRSRQGAPRGTVKFRQCPRGMLPIQSSDKCHNGADTPIWTASSDEGGRISSHVNCWRAHQQLQQLFALLAAAARQL